MDKIAIAIGGLLVALGIVCFVQTGASHPTALIPTFAGALIEFFGVLSMILPTMRMHLMHGAVLIGLLGFIGALGSLIGRHPSGIARIEMLVMLGLCGIFVVLCVFSFIGARRARLG